MSDNDGTSQLSEADSVEQQQQPRFISLFEVMQQERMLITTPLQQDKPVAVAASSNTVHEQVRQPTKEVRPNHFYDDDVCVNGVKQRCVCVCVRLTDPMTNTQNPFFTGIFADGRRCERREEARDWIDSVLQSKL
jgi:hypothetical protein